MVALQCHDVFHVCSETQLLPTEPLTQDQARRLPRISFRAACLSECAQTCPSDRRSHLAAANLLLGRGQQLRTDGGQVRASTRLSADASGFIKCHCEVDGPVHVWLSETPVLDLPHVFQNLLE